MRLWDPMTARARTPNTAAAFSVAISAEVTSPYPAARWYLAAVASLPAIREEWRARRRHSRHSAVAERRPAFSVGEDDAMRLWDIANPPCWGTRNAPYGDEPFRISHRARSHAGDMIRYTRTLGGRQTDPSRC